jgi:hypothetical protein
MGKKRLVLTILLTILITAVAAPLWMGEDVVNRGKLYSLVDVMNDGKITNPLKLIDSNVTDFADSQVSVDVERKGFVLELKVHSKQQTGEAKFKVHGNGSLKLNFGGALVPDDPGDDKSFHKIYVRYSDVKLNGQTIVTEKTLCHDEAFSYSYEKPVKDGEIVTLSYKVKRIVSFRNFDGYFLVIVLTLAFLLSYKLVQYISRFKLEEHTSRIDIVFVCCFFVLLFIPMSNVSHQDRTVSENRMLATYQPLFKGGQINPEYGKQFEAWFNDRFGYRKKVIAFYDRVVQLSGLWNGNAKVLVGKNGWLFYKSDDTLLNYSNKVVLNPESMAHGLDYLSALNSWAKRHNKKFYYVIAPDKNKIYGEYFRLVNKVKPDSEGIGNQFFRYIKANSDIDVIYLYETLLKHKQDGWLYWKEDTHWNQYGAYVGYLEIMNHITKDFKIKPYVVHSWQMNPHGGVLRQMLGDAYVEDKAPVLYKEPVHTVAKNCAVQASSAGGSEYRIDCENPRGKGKVFVLRDSFSIDLLEYYARTFAKVTAVWRYDITPEYLDLIDKQFDIVILENVERAIPIVLNVTFDKE